MLIEAGIKKKVYLNYLDTLSGENPRFIGSSLKYSIFSSQFMFRFIWNGSDWPIIYLITLLSFTSKFSLMLPEIESYLITYLPSERFERSYKRWNVAAFFTLSVV